MHTPSPIPWHTLSTEDALLNTGSRASGLSEDEAAARLLRDGPNALSGSEQQSVWGLLFSSCAMC